MTEYWDEIQRKWDLVRVCGEFKLSGLYCICKFWYCGDRLILFAPGFW